MDIKISKLGKSYYLNNEKISVFNNVNFSIQKGDFISLTGASGIGKSTLLHILGTLDAPTSGLVSFDEEDVFSKSDSQIAQFRNQNIGFIFQFHHLLPEFSALENVMMPMLIGQANSAKASKVAKELLDQVGLAQRFSHKPGELSGGEQQRVALARALSKKPQLLLADEPTGNLDENTGTEVIDIIKKINKSHSLTALIVTHNKSLSSQAPKKMVLQKDGLHWV